MERYRLAADHVEVPDGHSHMSLDEWTKTDKAALPKQFPMFAIDDDREIDSIIRPPNCPEGTLEQILERGNGGRAVPPAVRGVPWGYLVEVGQIMLVSDNGRVSVVGPGRWAIKLSYKCWAKFGPRKDLREDAITHGTFTLARVERGQLGLAVENGRPVLLKEGVHVYNDPLFSFKCCRPMNAEHVQHISYHVIRVPKGSFARISEQGRAKLLPEGVHAVDNAVFEYAGLVNTIEEYISHGTLHIIQVPKGRIGLVFEGGYPRFLHEGVHIYDSPTLKFQGIQGLMSQQISHGTLSRFRIQKGEVALAWFDNQPELIEEPGTYQIDSADFRLVALKATSDKLIALGAKKIVTVNAGEVAVTFKGGTLRILQPGRHYIGDTDHRVDDFLSTQQRMIRLEQPSGPGGRAAVDDLLVCETKDLVKIGIRADVFYRIQNPEQAIMEVGREFISELVKETSIATLINIVRSTSLAEIAQNSQPSAGSELPGAGDLQAAQALASQPSAPLFFDQAHDQFLAKLHDDFASRYGLEITNIRIEQFKILDEKLQNSIAGQAAQTAATQTELANLQAQTQIATQQQEREARMQQIRAESDARMLQTKASAEKAQAEALAAAQQVKSDMEANTRRTAVQAEADAIRMRAQAEADAAKIEAGAIVSRAQAEADAIKLKAAAEGERARLLAATPLGEKLSLLEMYGDMVKASNSGVSKVVYVDPATTQGMGNPFGMFTLQSLAKDLQTLSGAEP